MKAHCACDALSRDLEIERSQIKALITAGQASAEEVGKNLQVNLSVRGVLYGLVYISFEVMRGEPRRGF